MLRLLSLFALLLAFGFGCLFSSLPQQMPEDLTITWHEGGGENPSSSTATITLEESSWSFARYGQEEQRTFPVTEEEMQALYTLMRRNKIDTVQQKNQQKLDTDHEGFELQWRNEHIVVSGAQVATPDRARYTQVYDAIEIFLLTKVPERPFSE